MTITEKKGSQTPWLTDGGIETTFIFHHGIDLPHFAAFELLSKPQHRQLLIDYYRQYLDLAKKYGMGFILESATWRASSDWAYKLGYTEQELIDINRISIRYLQMLKMEYHGLVDPIVISGCIGPRSDGYRVSDKMSVEQAQEYHSLQIRTFKDAGADRATALTINYIDEGLGIVWSAMEHNLPVIISFTVETDGRLPSGETLREAIERIDRETVNYPLYYMINCAHPTHFAQEITTGASWTDRIGGIRANASCKSHAELDEAVELDTGDKDELAGWYQKLNSQYAQLKVFGGCCGTDVTHLQAICKAISPSLHLIPKT